MICDELLSAELVSLEVGRTPFNSFASSEELETSWLKDMGKKVASHVKAFAESTKANAEKETTCFSRFFFVTPPTTWRSRLVLNALFAPFVVARNGLQVDLGPYPDLK